MRSFVECTECHVWSDIPQGFRETIHFAKCPKCSGPMYLCRGITPEEVGLSATKKVSATLMLHGEKM